jgi:hypothetical protein
MEHIKLVYGIQHTLKYTEVYKLWSPLYYNYYYKYRNTNNITE